jgi:hypothetical protein
MREQIDNLIPKQFQPFILGGIIFIILLMVYMTTMRGDGSVKIGETMPNNEQAQALAVRLESGSGGVKTFIHHTSEGYEVRVAGNKEEAANRMLSRSGKVTDFAKIKCTKPGSFGSTADKDAYTRCQVKQDIQKTVEALPGVLAASATFDEAESGSLVGNDTVGEATVQIMKDANATGELDGESMALMIAGTSTSLSPENITIQDTEGNTLWNGAHPTGTDALPAGCTADAMDLECKTRQVKNEMERDLGAKIAGLAGGPENVKVSVFPVLNPSSKIESETTSSDGAKVSSNSSGGDSGANSTTYSPNIDSMQSQTEPGNVEQVRVSVLLNGVKPAIEDAVRDYIGNLVNVRRGDSISVRTTKWAAPKKESQASTAEAETAADKPVIDEKAAAATKTLIVAGFIALMAAAAAIALLWRRGQRLSSERSVFEDEFRNDMTRYQSVADRTPQALAEEIETWLNQQGPRSGVNN